MNEASCAHALDTVADAVASAQRVVVMTGAGMSVASGLPTYRGVAGLYNEMTIDEGLPVEEILHAYMLVRNPALTWKYIAQIERACRSAEPNPGHEILARWGGFCDLHVVTQNVDGLHRAAGSRQVIELHGNLSELFCCACAARFSMRDFDLDVLPPRCSECDGLVRPSVVLFGESLPNEALEAFACQMERGFDVVLVVGTSAGFPYVYEPVVQAAARGSLTVEVNPAPTALTRRVNMVLPMPALDALRGIDERLVALSQAQETG